MATITLLILRNGKSLSSTGIPILEGTEQIEKTIGRREILSSQHMACGCSKSSPWSTKDKCSECSSVNEWAASTLSRHLLRFTREETTNVVLQGRGTHSVTTVDGRALLLQEGDWSSPVPLHNGSRIQLAPIGTTATEKTLELEVVFVVVDYKGDSDTSLLHSLPPAVNQANPDVASPNCIQSESDKPIESLPVITKQSIFPTPNEDQVIPIHQEKTRKFWSIFLVPLGQDMSTVMRTILAKKIETLGAKVTQNIFDATHLVISSQVTSLDEIGCVVNISRDDLEKYIETKEVVCAIPKWITSATRHASDENGGGGLQNPSVTERWYGTTTNRQRRSETVLPLESVKRVRYNRNEQVSKVFRTLSNLHKSCPLLPQDEWKAYMFRIISGRLVNLDFEITDHPDTLRRLSSIKGIGANSVAKIKEILETGTVARIAAFYTDPDRVAMSNMMAIWGVGRKKALELLKRGYKSISDVRQAILAGGRFLERNQLVGVDCYEDILEEMDRPEVEAIGNIVRNAANEIFPGAEVRIMGSYRREHVKCGDVDVHITHKSYDKQNPVHGLAKIIDLLWEQGHLVFHLSFFEGMTTGRAIADFVRSSRHIPKEAWEASHLSSYEWKMGHKGSSYMGVLRSPKDPEKRRRVDIKFYPYRERIFAALYFTGNGYFNRSMRLWAKTKFRYRLNDNGLFIEGTQDRVMEASEEVEVFDKLGLIYKEPKDRDCFDALESKNGFVDLELSEAQFKEDKNYQWVN